MAITNQPQGHDLDPPPSYEEALKGPGGLNPTPVPEQTVIVNYPLQARIPFVPLPKFGPIPIEMICSYCQNQIRTETQGQCWGPSLCSCLMGMFLACGCAVGAHVLVVLVVLAALFLVT